MISLEELDTIVRFGKDTVSALYGVPVAFCHEVKTASVPQTRQSPRVFVIGVCRIIYVDASKSSIQAAILSCPPTKTYTLNLAAEEIPTCVDTDETMGFWTACSLALDVRNTPAGEAGSNAGQTEPYEKSRMPTAQQRRNLGAHHVDCHFINRVPLDQRGGQA